jgi:hypothetical protein
MGYSVDWLPDGRLLVTGDKLRRQEPDGSMVTHAQQGGNEIVVDGRGNIYINGADFDFAGGEAPKPGYIKLITLRPSGWATQRSRSSQVHVLGRWPRSVVAGSGRAWA